MGCLVAYALDVAAVEVHRLDVKVQLGHIRLLLLPEAPADDSYQRQEEDWAHNAANDERDVGWAPSFSRRVEDCAIGVDHADRRGDRDQAAQSVGVHVAAFILELVRQPFQLCVGFLQVALSDCAVVDGGRDWFCDGEVNDGGTCPDVRHDDPILGDVQEAC